jgi:multiple sugar transport system substrate-binding protein
MSKQSHRRCLFAFLLLVCLTLPLSCASAASRVLRVMDWKINETPQTQAWFQFVKERFEQLHPDVEVQLETVGWGTAYRDRVAITSAAGDPPDVVALSVVWAMDLYRQGALMPLNQYLAATPQLQPSKFVPSAPMYTSLNGVFFGVPHELGAAALLYDLDAFEESGLSTDPFGIPDWRSFLEASRKLQIVDGDGRVRRYAYQFGLYPESFSTWYSSNGGLYYAPDLSRVTLNTPQAVDTLKFILEMRSHDLFGGNMAEGTAAIMQGGNWVPYFLRVQAPALRFNITSFPKGPEGLHRGGTVWTNMVSIPVGAAEPDLAWEWITYYTGLEGATEFFRFIGTASSPRLDFYQSAIWRAQQREDPWKAMIAEIAQAPGIYPFIRYEDWLANIWPTTFAAAWDLHISPEEALAKADEQYNRMLQELTGGK